MPCNIGLEVEIAIEFGLTVGAWVVIMGRGAMP